MIQQSQDSFGLKTPASFYNTEIDPLTDYFANSVTTSMDYTNFYPAQNYDIVFGAAGETPVTAAAGPNANSAEEFSNASPPPYGNYDGFGYDRNSMNGQSTSAQIAFELESDHQQRARSSSEEKELTPQQYRRKAQNRAAQRAFRERKERHVKELEQKVSSLEQSSSEVMAENERLKRELQKISTENQILRATSGQQHFNTETNEEVHVGPHTYSPTTFYANLLQPHANKTPSHRITHSPTTGERLLGAGATWDMIVQDPLFARGLVDVGDVCERIKVTARCDGQGPVFEESAIREAIRQSAASGKDELI